jgi:hypothetical protein
VKHSEKSKVTMYIDHGDWAKETVTTKKRTIGSKMSKKMTEEDAEDSTEHNVANVPIA